MLGNRKSVDQGLGALLLNWKAFAYGSSKMLRACRLMTPRLFAKYIN
jgi:hypothetical protein